MAESEDFEYLENEWKKQYLKNYYLRCSAQRRFLGLLRGSIQGLMEPEFAKIKALDFLQGMPVLVALREVTSDVVQSELPALQAQALGVGKELVAESKSSYEEISSKAERIVELVERVLISAGMWTNQTLLRITIILRSTRSLIRLRLLRILARRLQRSQRSTSSLTSAASVPRPRPSPSPRLNI